MVKIKIWSSWELVAVDARKQKGVGTFDVWVEVR